MLSYRHAYHAGNFADVLKHSVLSLVLDYMLNKEKGFSYVDTHAGAGMYRLSDASAQKTGEYLDGISKLWQRNDLPEELAQYIELIHELNPNKKLNIYPGSPSIAQNFLRRQDASFLYDLHPTDFGLLSELFEQKRKVQVYKTDGYKSLKGQLPPTTRRGVVLIDPPYEMKTDYVDAVTAITKGYRMFSGGVYILWYPVVHRHYIDQMERQFCDSDVRNVLQLELQMAPDNEEYGMTGTGLFIVNPPWTLTRQAEAILPYLTTQLGDSDSSYLVRQLIEE
ncbi:MAG: 23S rRNA (adenine(2030)-N(6))-methyltransferase RlmJ [Psychrosphaera sp.]|nr:23S rRNA (adenine(2030)-N(6))-methyltransferase RlmJ [Psychrosphaera sp.]